MNHPDITYIIFCRIAGIKAMTTEDIAAAVSALEKVVGAASAARYESHTSVYGCLVLVPLQVKVALEISKTILREASAAGVDVAIGIACGTVADTEDILGNNIAGVWVNCAARLAHLPSGEGRIAAEETVAQEAMNTSSSFRRAFGELTEERVKKTRLKFRWLYTDPQIKGSPPLAPSPPCWSMHVVVYDIVEFSTLDLQGLRDILQKLRSAVLDALTYVNIHEPRKANDQLWYAPAGDGGVLVFRSGRIAWQFAKALRIQAETETRKVPLRVGVATGSFCDVGGVPVGSSVFEADSLSALPATGDICVSRRFWENVLEDTDRRKWTADEHPANKNARLLHSTGTLPLKPPHLMSHPISPIASASCSIGAKTPDNNLIEGVFEHFKSLKHHQYSELCTRLRIPLPRRPPDVLADVEKRNRIVEWADEEHKINDLRAELLALTTYDSIHP